MARTHHPHKGSKAYHPRKRASRIYHSFSTKPLLKEQRVGEFAGYKVGMTQVSMISDAKGSPTYNQEIVVPVTILETPPLKVIGIRAYSSTPYGLRIQTEFWAIEKEDKNLSRKVALPKKMKTTLADLEKNLNSFSDLRLIIQTQPSKGGVGKRTPEIFEIGIGGANIPEKFSFAKQKIGAEINVTDVFKPGQLVDISAVTKGFGFQGSIKRWGIRRLSHKAQKIRRKVATLGPWHPHKVRWTVPQMGQTGYHTRTEYNKRILR